MSQKSVAEQHRMMRFVGRKVVPEWLLAPNQIWSKSKRTRSKSPQVGRFQATLGCCRDNIGTTLAERGPVLALKPGRLRQRVHPNWP